MNSRLAPISSIGARPNFDRAKGQYGKRQEEEQGAADHTHGDGFP